MSKQDRGLGAPDTAVAMRVKLINLLRVAEGANHKAVTNQPDLEKECLSTEGAVLAQHEFTNLLLQASTKTQPSISDRIGTHIFDTFALSVYADELRETRKQVETSHGRALRQIALKPALQAALDAQFTAYEQIADSVDARNPLNDAKFDADFIKQMSSMPIPLEPTDVATLDEVFRQTDDPEDVMFATFLFYLANNSSAAKPSSKFQENLSVAMRSRLISVTQSYMSARFDQLVQSRFVDAKKPEDILPKDAPLLPVVLAVQFAQAASILPQNFALLMEEDYIPGLTADTKNVLTTYYNNRFQQQQKQLMSVPDDEGYLPYAHAFDAVANGEGVRYLRNVVQDYTRETTQEAGTMDNMNWLQANFDSIRNRVTSTRTVGAEQGVAAVDFSSYTVPNTLPTNATIDMTVVANDYRAYTLQVDRFGHIAGLPLDIQKEGASYVDHLVGKLRSAIEQKGATTASPSRRTVLPPANPIRSAASSEQSSKTREERKREYAERRALKRKALRRLGVTDPEAIEEGTQIAPTDMPAEAKRQFHIDLTLADTFIQQRDALPEKMQARLAALLERVSQDQAYVQNYLKPLKNEDPKFKDINAYSARLGIDWRVIFVQMGSGQMVVTSVEPRGRVYDNLQADYAAMLKKLQGLQ